MTTYFIPTFIAQIQFYVCLAHFRHNIDTDLTAIYYMYLFIESMYIWLASIT